MYGNLRRKYRHKIHKALRQAATPPPPPHKKINLGSLSLLHTHIQAYKIVSRTQHQRQQLIVAAITMGHLRKCRLDGKLASTPKSTKRRGGGWREGSACWRREAGGRAVPECHKRECRRKAFREQWTKNPSRTITNRAYTNLPFISAALSSRACAAGINTRAGARL